MSRRLQKQNPESDRATRYGLDGLWPSQHQLCVGVDQVQLGINLLSIRAGNELSPSDLGDGSSGASTLFDTLSKQAARPTLSLLTPAIQQERNIIECTSLMQVTINWGVS
jgi:hypothetical protein